MLNSFKKCFGKGTYLSNNVSILQIIDKNTQGEISLILFQGTKYIFKSHNKPKIYDREIYFLDKLNNDTIIKRESKTLVINNKVGILFPYYSNGDLFNYLNNNKLTEKDVINIIGQIANIIKYVHDLGIIHNDIKLENFILDNKQQIILIDMGMALQLQNANDSGVYNIIGPEYINLNNHTCGGTKGYNAPEKDLGLTGKPCDIWGMGIICYALILRKMPYNYKTKTLHINFNSTINVGIKNLIISMLEIDYKKRPTIEYICLKLREL